MSLLELKEGDLVVHVTHGIGRYRGLVRRRRRRRSSGSSCGSTTSDPDKLFVPSDQLDRVQKYIGSDDAPPTIHRLGSGEWSRTKSRVKAKVREMAKELLQLYAARQRGRRARLLAGHRLAGGDGGRVPLPGDAGTSSKRSGT